jgi:mxaJ protein
MRGHGYFFPVAIVSFFFFYGGSDFLRQGVWDGVNHMKNHLKRKSNCMGLRRVVFLWAAIVLGVFALEIPADAKTLRVCADPNYLPYSNRAGEGFENKIAEAVAKLMGMTVEYTWASYRGKGGFPQFLVDTLEANKCDLIMNLPYGSREASTTEPYYISTYVFVYKKKNNYKIESMDSPILKTLRIGYEEDTPIEDAVKIRGMFPKSTHFDIGEDNESSPVDMLKAVQAARIDVLITWEPAIGSFLVKYPELEVVPVPNDRALGPPEQFAFPMAMGVREGDETLRNALNDVIAKHKPELTSILTRNGVKLFTPKDPNAP